MESAKKALGITKYFISLPSSKEIAILILLFGIIGGIILNQLIYKGSLNTQEIFYFIGLGSIGLIFPTFFISFLVKIFRKKIQLNQALFISFLTMLIHIIFSSLALFLASFSILFYNLILIGFAFTFLLWFFSFSLIFGFKKSSIIFAILQTIVYLIAFSLSFSIIQMESNIVVKLVLSVLALFVLIYFILYISSGPLKRNLGIGSTQIIELFFSQWLYGKKDMEDALDELGEKAKTWIAICSFKTKTKFIHLIVPYFHFGPFGNLGGSDFSYRIEEGLKNNQQTVFVFHGTATHSMDPVSSSSINSILKICKEGLKKIEYKPAYFAIKKNKYKNTTCYLLEINNYAIASYTRAPFSTEDINVAIGWALMEHMEKKFLGGVVIDCHNCETNDVDYIEPGSEASFELLEALKKCKKQKSFLSRMKVGSSTYYPEDIQAIASGGIKVLAFEGENRLPNFIVLLDSNSTTAQTREEILQLIKNKYPKTNFAEVYTTDTHELNTVRGVFNPAGLKDQEKILKIIEKLLDEAYNSLEYADFGMRKEQIELKVIGPYQTAEITATLNSIFAVLKILLPALTIATIIFLIWFLGKL
jgi:predicted neutral ceramidase superfamily lipid hydrolase